MKSKWADKGEMFMEASLGRSRRAGGQAPPGFILSFSLLLTSVDRDPFHLPLRRRQLGQRHSENPVLERRGNLVLVDVVDGNVSLETPVVALAEATLLVFRFALLLAADGQHAVREFDRHVVLVETG